MAARAAGRGSGHGIDGAILETSLGSTGTVLEADLPETGRRKRYIGNAAFGAGAVQSRTAGTQEGFPRCCTSGEATGGPGTNSELCARYRAPPVPDRDAEEIPVDAQSRDATEPNRV